MRVHKKRRLLLLSLLSLCLVLMTVYYFKINHIENIENEIHNRKSLLDKVFIALLNVVEFLRTDMQDIIMDGLFGFRICQGTLIGALQDCSRENYNCPEELRMKLRSTIDRLGELGDKALPYVQEKDEDYYNNYINVLNVPFVLEYKPETLSRDIQPIPLTSRSYNGRKGDSCFGGIMGTLMDNGRKSPPCTIVDGCWDLMTVKGTIGYFTTHQLLFLLFGEHSGCVPTLEDQVRKDMSMSLREWQRHLCEQIYRDATIREYNLKLDVESEDLFLEEIVLCGILGFQNFFNETWIQMVLTWQKPRGCFAAPDTVMDVMVAIKNTIQEFNDLTKQTSGEEGVSIDKDKARVRLLHLKLDNIRQNTQLTQRVQSVNYARGVASRSLMSEAIMGDDCLSHKTGLGAAALASFVRYLVSELHGKN